MNHAYDASPIPHFARARAASGVLAVLRWRVVLAAPVPARCVVIFYPHTSNWDFGVGLLAKWSLGIPFHWVGKDTLFRWPIGGILSALGGIAVNRRERSGFIERLAGAFSRAETLRLVIAPEGTRAHTEYWKSGFYHLARAAKVPVALAFIDYARREVGLAGCIELTGDMPHDMLRIARVYAGKRGRRPAQQAPVRLREPAAPDMAAADDLAGLT